MNRENADNTMMKILSKYAVDGKKPMVMLHVCCAPCASASIERIHPLTRLTLLFYNPNIMPQQEYEKRKAELIRMVKENPDYADVKFVDIDYDNSEYLQFVRGHEKDEEQGERCTLCFTLRLRKTAQIAKRYGCEFFATTLTIGPKKNTDVISAVGRGIAKEEGIEYLPTDFKRKKGYERSLQLSSELALYRQSYCGCAFARK
ncbi:MAG: epoxyqueuosine reductase QueH [Paludibacteraceae bacterium]|nr:epoxyqueuosine reductase QueH [Paludibacteraceae bacterium]